MKALVQVRVYLMGVYQDGIIDCGETIEQAGAALVAQLSLTNQN